MIKFIIVFLFLFFISCNNNDRIEKNKIIARYSVINKSLSTKIDPKLKKGILDLIELKDHEDFSNIDLSESCLVLMTKVDPKDSIIYFSDSTIFISYNVYGRTDFESYKGVLNIEGYNIAILDFGNFGNMFYNSDSLIQIPFETFKNYPRNIISGETFYVKNRQLKLWCP